MKPHQSIENHSFASSSVLNTQAPEPNTNSSFLVTSSHNTSMQQTSSELNNKKSIQQVHELYNQIHLTINDMDSKVQHVIKKHEAEFLFAYRNHIKKIKKELSEIKYKSEEQEKMFSSNDRIQYLEQQLAIFREETMKIYNKLDQKNVQIDILKLKVKDLEKEVTYANSELRQQVKKSMVFEVNRLNYEEKIANLQFELDQRNKQVQKMTQKLYDIAQRQKSSIKQNSSGYGSKTFTYEHLKRSDVSKTSPLHHDPKSPVRSLNSSVNVTNSNFYNLSSPQSPRIYETDLKNWFLECIKTVKREIAQRNNHEKSLELNNITSIDEFLMIDKLRLLEIFLENEKLLTYMYEKIFPDRLTSLRQKLNTSRPLILPKGSLKQVIALTQREQKPSQLNQGLLTDRYKTHTKISHLPKVMARVSEHHKHKLSQKAQWKGNVILKNGKLNISIQ